MKIVKLIFAVLLAVGAVATCFRLPGILADESDHTTSVLMATIGLIALMAAGSCWLFQSALKSTKRPINPDGRSARQRRRDEPTARDIE